MKILFICPPFSELSQRDMGMPIAPPVLEYLAGLTLKLAPDSTVVLLDAQHEPFDPAAVDADLVGISVMTAQAVWATVEVVTEVAASRRRLLWCIDDNVWGVNPKRSLDLFREMGESVRGKWWFGSGDLRTIQQPGADELLKQARRAGMTAVMLGWETENPASLEEYRAVTKQGSDRRDALRRIRDNGIDVMLFIVVGGRRDTRKDFEDILKLCDDLKVSAHPVMLTPLPDTELFEQYRPYLYPDMDWDLYDGNHAVFEHPMMTPLEREAAFIRLRTTLFTPRRILGRIRQVSWRGFPMSHISSFMLQYPQGRIFRKYADQWMQEHPEHAAQAGTAPALSGPARNVAH